MALIDFTDPALAGTFGIDICDTGGLGNTLPHPIGVDFIIIDGSMELMVSGGGTEFLFFSQVACAVGTGAPPIRPVATVVIRFPAPQEYVRISAWADEHGIAPYLFNYYSAYGGAPADLVHSDSIPFVIGQVESVFSNSAQPIMEVMVRTDRPECGIWFVEFFDSVATIRHDISLALDGSGSMSQQNKWNAMIEAADIFHDLYRAMGDPTDGLGAVRFRWDCGNVLGGDQTMAQPALGPLSGAVDLPAIYAGDAPGDCTPIGQGVIEAANQAAGGGNPVKHVLLLTDGKNNRGLTVPQASANSALASTSVHTIGLGSGVNIDPVEIAQLAADHGGSFQQTTDPSQILDFFAQALNEMLGKAEMAIVSGDNVTIAPGTLKAVFLVAWSDPAVANDFDLAMPDGTPVDHSAPPSPPGVTINYFPKDTNTAHAYFVVEGAISGTWQFVNAPAAAERLVVEDLELRVDWRVTPQVGVAGEPITVTCRITRGGHPFNGAAEVVGRVVRPDEAQGDFIARGMRRSRLTPRPAGDTSLRSAVIGGVLKLADKKDFLFEQDTGLVAQKSGDGLYTLTYTATQHDGVYNFELEARGTGDVEFGRRISRSVVLTSNADSSSEVSIALVGSNVYQAVVTPQMSSGTLAGPFLASQMSLQVSDGKPIGALKDNLDGSYVQLIRTTRGEPPQVSLRLQGRTIPLSPADTSDGDGASSPVFPDLLMPILYTILLIVVILLLLRLFF